MVSERQARMGLAAISLGGTSKLSSAVQEYGAAEVWDGIKRQPDTALGRRAKEVSLSSIEEATIQSGARFVVPGDAEWPVELAALEGVEVAGLGGVPMGLWLRGHSLEVLGAVALVGARACTQYGQQCALQLAADLVGLGRVVVSGLAYGIDSAAHRGALGSAGSTTAVIASGVDVPYPAGNASLAERILDHGTLVSEAPPGHRPTRHGFLARNRVIAALSAGVVVVEAALRSGAKNSATWASALGRPVFAVPGPIHSALSATPHNLIREQVGILVNSAAEIHEALSPLDIVAGPSGRGRSRPIDALDAQQLLVRDAFDRGEVLGAAALSRRTGLNIIDVLAIVGELIESGWLAVDATGSYQLAWPSAT